MSITRHHAEWLSLIDISGPFLSLPVLMKAFPQGLHAHDSEHAQTLKLAYQEWHEGAQDPSIHRAWIRHVLSNTLDFKDDLLAEGQQISPTLQCEIPEHRETIRPDIVLTDPSTGNPRALIKTYPAAQDLSKHVQGSRWNQSPGTVMSVLLRSVGVRLGLVTNGEQWMLVDAPKDETAGFASWFAQYWFEEPITLRAFRSLLSAERFFGVPENDTLEALLARSAEDQQEVTNQLGLQVRKAVEVLIQALDKADLDLNRTLLTGISEKQLYESAVTLMMRLVFLFCAEERGLLLLGDDLYDSFYAVSTLREQLRTTADQHGEEILERQKDAWVRLLATFRAVHGGVCHEQMRLPAYGGHLFDPDRFPFLEGRKSGTSWHNTPAVPLPIHNRTVLHLLEALQTLQVKLPGGPAESRKLSFTALGVEQIGHVYEGLLDHTAKRAPEVVLGLQGSKNKEPEIALSELERQIAKGEKQFLAYLKEETGRSDAALKKSLAKQPEDAEISRLRTACQADEDCLRRVLPFANLVRLDTSDYPYVIPTGGVYVTAGTDRRSSGTHYTPPSLTEPIVQHTLEPLIYPEMAKGKAKEESRRLSIEEILNLKVCDMAMGSAAFLVQAIRFLAAEIVQRWADAERAAQERGDSLPILTAPYADPATGKVAEQPIPADETERTILAKRIVAERCIYGVDINPMAVEIAKLSIWLETMAKDRPFSFVDHALRCGDSLLGCITLDQVRNFHLDPKEAATRSPFLRKDERAEDLVIAAANKAIEKRRRLESFVVNDARDAERKVSLLAEAEAAMAPVYLAGDLLIGAALRIARQEGEFRNYDDLTQALLDDHLQFAIDPLTDEKHRIGHQQLLEYAARAMLSYRDVPDLPMQANPDSLGHYIDQLHRAHLVSETERHPFHWALEFPEVFVQAGFDAIVGNPPFQGGQKITGALGTDFRDYLVEHLAGGRRGSADLSAYFFLRANVLLKNSGAMGLLATNTIAQGDTREVGLEALVGAGKEVKEAEEDENEGGNGRSNPRFVNKRNWRIPAMPGGPDSGATAVIYRAIPSRKWPGQANLEVAEAWLRKGDWGGPFFIDDKPVSGITPFLTAPGKSSGTPFRLKANEGKSFQGSIVLGMGFVLSPDEAQALIAANPKNKDVLFPYLNGDDLNSRPDQSPSRWVINFFDWPLNRSAEGSWRKTKSDPSKAAQAQIKAWLQAGRVPADYPDPVAEDYPDCLRILDERVRPERTRKNDKGEFALRYPLYLKWWIYGEKRPALYAEISGMGRVIAIPRVSKYLNVSFTPKGLVCSEATVIIADTRAMLLAIIQSSIHEAWTQKLQSSLETRGRYTPSDCFETFPLPKDMLNRNTNQYHDLESIGENYHIHRQRIMRESGEGLTTVYNRLHNSQIANPEIAELRRQHAQMDQAVAAAYGWTTGGHPINLGHGFHEIKQGIRYTVSPAARQEILDRLLELNHARYAEEVRLGLHDKGGKWKKQKGSDSPTEFFGGQG